MVALEAVITTREMRALERNAEYFGISLVQLMENAGGHVAREVAARFPSRKTRVAVFCGLGGNGGDGFVAARHLLAVGYPVQVVAAGEGARITHDAAARNWAALQALRRPEGILEVHDSAQVPALKADVVVDALLGTGLQGAPREPVLSLIHAVNAMPGFKLAVDVPSGLDSDSGAVWGDAVRADVTIAFHRPKPGLVKATERVGELLVRDIGLPRELEGFAGPGDVALVVSPRQVGAHKGEFGRLLVVGGSETYSGAPALVALGALRSGVDLAYVAAPERTARDIASFGPDLITIKLDGGALTRDNVPEVRRWLGTVTGVVVGPGLGVGAETGAAVEAVVAAVEEAGKPLLLDADGLKAFAGFARPLRVPLVVTPHGGEFEVLTGKALPADVEERGARVRKAAERLRAVVLAKGATDVVSDGRRVKRNFTGNPGMTVGGTGDVLAGVVGAFLAQGADPFEAAVAGAFVNGAAGDFVRSEKGFHMVASDLLTWLPRVLDDPMSHLQVRGRAA